MPSCTSLPWSKTQILSAFRMVESRWAMTTQVSCRLSMIESSVVCTSDWLWLSSAEVASSSSSTFGSCSSARAIAIRCFCPPEI